MEEVVALDGKWPLVGGVHGRLYVGGPMQSRPLGQSVLRGRTRRDAYLLQTS